MVEQKGAHLVELVQEQGGVDQGRGKWIGGEVQGRAEVEWVETEGAGVDGGRGGGEGEAGCGEWDEDEPPGE